MDNVERQLAEGFDALVGKTFPVGSIPVEKIGSVVACLLGTYCLYLTPVDRMLVLSETVNSILKMFNDNYNYDLH